jgi:hypothetical protein
MNFFERALAVGTLSLAAASVGAQAPKRTTVEIKTPLKLLGPEGTLSVMANETRASADATTVTVVFRDAHDRALKTVSTTYRAGQPAVITLERSEVPDPDPFAPVWAEVAVSRSGDFSSSAAGLSFVLVRAGGDAGCNGGCHTCPAETDDISCAQPEGGRKPEFSCPDGSAFVERISVVR